jgi:hypothetical protein
LRVEGEIFFQGGETAGRSRQPVVPCVAQVVRALELSTQGLREAHQVLGTCYPMVNLVAEGRVDVTAAR